MNILKTRILSFESLFCELLRKQIFAKAFANVVLPFAGPSYFNSPLNLYMEGLAAAQLYNVCMVVVNIQTHIAR